MNEAGTPKAVGSNAACQKTPAAHHLNFAAAVLALRPAVVVVARCALRDAVGPRAAGVASGAGLPEVEKAEGAALHQMLMPASHGSSVAGLTPQQRSMLQTAVAITRAGHACKRHGACGHQLTHPHPPQFR